MFFYCSVLFLSLLFTAHSLNQDGLFLQRVKLGLSDPAHSLSSWNERDDTPCNWYGITCDNSTHRVSSVDLSSSELMGPFPNFLCRLPFLTSINLMNNSINSSLTDDIATCQNLESLDLSANLLVGSIPASLSELSNLKLLNLASNNFSGAIPAKFGQFQKLEWISLAGNLLTGSIPSELGNISTLQHLLVGYNLYAPRRIPSQFGNLSNLVELWLANCNLVGPIPESLSKLTRLSNLDFSLNRLTGSIPSWLTGLKNIEQIELYQNSLSGELPLGFSNLTMLRRFDASTNQLTGTIPIQLAQLELESLNLFENRLVGTLPRGHSKVTKFVYLFELEENSFSGEVSSRIASAYILSVLKISKNQFSGSLPMEIGYLGKLIEFSASDNMFTGPIPGSLVNLSTLSMLVLENNELSGGLPDGIQGWKSLNELNLANNKLSGQIPDEIGSLKALNYLDLSGNYFSGKIPTQLEDLNLNQLNLSNNMLSGAIPPFYAKEMYRSSFMGNPGLCGDLKDLCPQEGDSRRQSYLWILRSTFILAATVFVVGVVWFYFKYQNFKKEKEVITISKWRSFHKIGFSEFEIIDFLKEDNVIGSGASGKVYKAVLSNGETVAVKKLGGESRKDNTNHSSEKDEFEAEAPAAILHQAPKKYAYTLRVNEKSDIYSFGVVILELVTGRLPVDPEFGEKDLVKWVCATLDQNGVDHEAGGMGHKPEADKNDEKPSPCYPEEVSDQGSLV
ncbi:hypothetical protein OIU85_007077 [Salix viminalis]|uniref:Protein kinase domain-containing protein n=1 Tax=Salix viminalis TaxID=40686 RepID=A0A9Q0P815_SALVM|nr:hypothetical protein OIU85_007077 [Salix viminalis]